MASVNTLLDLDSPSLPATHQSNLFDTANVNSISLMDPFCVNYEVQVSGEFILQQDSDVTQNTGYIALVFWH